MNFKVVITASFFGCSSLFSQTVAQTFEFMPGSNKDTINFTDVGGKKQGKWVLFGKHKPNTCFAPTQKAEEGAYKENRKTGVWMEYFCNGNPKNKITFVNGRPDGYAIVYYENGKVQEEGQWKNNRWVGALKQYYDNGQVQHDFKFNEGGKREGVQTYKYENGQTAIEGSFVNGKESGTIKEFHENGDLKAEKTYNNGNVDVASIKTYDPKKEFLSKKDVVENAPKITLKPDEKPQDAKAGPLVLNGKYTLYDKNKNVSKDGLFKDNRLMEGKAFIYNENGILTRVAIYKNGVYAGDGVIEN
ncbi:MAG: toxin-antitoxin system YwqK family antitoxin [Bacteroidetes bacterium]|nr:toxin-antitoxin system YwqK family antitoxin [Bacteroidota bacterium]